MPSKSLTLIPIVSIVYLLTGKEFSMELIFMIVLVFIYSLIYDLITKKNLNNMKLSLIYFVASVIVIYSYSYLITNIHSSDKYIDSKDLVSVSVNNSLYNYNANLSDIYINNKELIKIKVIEGCTIDKKEVAVLLADNTSSQVVQVIGSKIVLYKKNNSSFRKINIQKVEISPIINVYIHASFNLFLT